MKSTRPCPDLPKNPAKAMQRQIRARRLGKTTEKIYLSWLNRFLRFRDQTSTSPTAPIDAGQVASFLTHLAGHRRVSASTQNQALYAILFFTKHVLSHELGGITPIRARHKPRLPVVLSQDEIRKIFQELPEGDPKLALALLYGSGMRLVEGLRLRVKDVDLDRKLIVVRHSKGEKDRITMLPTDLVPALHKQIRRVDHLHQ